MTDAMIDAKTDAKTEAGPKGRRAREWILRSTPMRGARAELRQARAGRAGDLQQLRLLLEVARRVAEPAETLPPGSRPAVLLPLYRDAVYWALRARRADGGPDLAAPDLATLWAEADPAVLLRAAGDAGGVDAVKAALFQRSSVGAMDPTDEDAARLRAFCEALLWELEAPRRRVDQLLLERWSRILALVAVVALLALGIRTLALGPNLAKGRPFRTSSSFDGCVTDPLCDGLLFHTNPDNDPWVEFDLGAPKPVHRIEVTNRSSCCSERAVPLIAEVSLDRLRWTKVAERKENFDSWTETFPSQPARYVRLRVGRPSTLHLEKVVVR